MRVPVRHGLRCCAQDDVSYVRNGQKDAWEAMTFRTIVHGCYCLQMASLSSGPLAPKDLVIQLGLILVSSLRILAAVSP